MNNLYKKIIIFFVACFCCAAFFYFSQKKVEKVIAEHVDIVINNAVVVTLNNQLEIYNPGYVIIKDTKIISLGQGQVPTKYIAQKVIDAQEKVVMPGLVNTHSHSAMSLLNSVEPEKNLQDWLLAMQGYELNLSSDQVFWGSLLAQIKMIKSGTTLFNDMYMHPQSTIQAVRVSGMRAVVRVPLINLDSKIILDDEFLQQNRQALITFSVAPNPLLDYSVKQLNEISNLALEQNLLIHIHFAEDAEFRKKLSYNFSLSPIELLKQSGFLKNKIVLAHSAELTENEIKELSKFPNIGISFNPISEDNLKTPLTPVASMLNNNIIVGFGTDGEPSSNLSLFEQIKFAVNGNINCLVGYKFCNSGKSLDPEKIVKMLTIDAAKMLGLEEKVGSLEVGKQADLIFIDIKDIGDIKEIYRRVVYNVSEGNVTSSIIAGKVIMENKRILTFDELDVIQKAKIISEVLQ